MNEPPVSALAVAEAFLHAELEAGARHGVELTEIAKTRGISASTLMAARRSLGIVSRRESWGPRRSGLGRWVWEIPESERRRQQRRRVIDSLADRLERDEDLTAESRAAIRRALDELVRQGLAEEEAGRQRRRCRRCGRLFEPSHPTAAYCSPACRRRRTNERARKRA